jgi:hypothetical protein
MQTLGGHGYIREFGMEQFVRDARIAQIYEGTNAVQALDLVGRKLPMEGGRLVKRFFTMVGALIEQTKNDPALQELAAPLADALGLLQKATGALATRGAQNPEEAAAAATDYLHLFGYVSLGYMWLRMARVAESRRVAGDGQTAFYETKLKTARFYFAKLLPRTQTHFATLMTGATSVMAHAVSEF